MTKRSTADVLRAEVQRAAREVDRAKERVAKATASLRAARKAEDDQVAMLAAARDGLARAEAALDAFLPGTLESLVEAAKERQETTGTHDPADQEETSPKEAEETAADS